MSQIAPGEPVSLLAAGVPPTGIGAETVDADLLVHGVVWPRLVPFLPPAERATGTAIVVCPGGGYRILDWTRHVERLAERLVPLGIAVLGVRYRTTPPSAEGPAAALADLHAALRVTGERAAGWRIRSDRLVGLGYSAGANLLLRYAAISGAGPAADARLAGMALLCLWPHDRPVAAYPLRPDAPDALLCATEEDTVAPVGFARGIAAALRLAGRSARLVAYQRGDHLAFNFNAAGPTVDWVPDFLAWLDERGLR